MSSPPTISETQIYSSAACGYRPAPESLPFNVREMNLPDGPRIARYFFYLYKGEEVIPDERGVELDSVRDPRDLFVETAREMLRIHELDTSELEGWEVRVLDVTGSVVATFRMGDL